VSVGASPNNAFFKLKAISSPVCDDRCFDGKYTHQPPMICTVSLNSAHFELQ